MNKALVFLCLLCATPLYAQQFIPTAFWEFLHPEPQGNNLRAVKMIDSLTYISVGDQGTIVRTSDDGASWKVTNKVVGFTGILTSIDFGTASTGACLGVSSVFFTNDTGKSWRRIDLPTTVTMNRIYYATPSRVFCVGKDGTIMLSVDSGKAWVKVALESGTDLKDIYFMTPSYGITCGTDGVRFLSRDSGKTWNVFTDSFGNNMYAVDFFNGKDGAISGELSAIYLTKDSAKSWQKQAVSPKGGCNDVIMLSPMKTIVVCDWRGIYRTTDGGTSWWNDQPFSPASLKGVSFASDKKNGVSVGSNGIIMRTYNGADSWEVVFDRVVVNAVGLESVYAITETTVIASGTTGLIIRSVDGGKKWTNIPNPSGSTLYDTDFQTPLVGTMVGGFGMIIRTRDGGLTWTQQTSGTTSDLRGVDFLDSNNGVACGPKGVVLMTQNGGKSWLNIAGNPDTVSFQDVAYTAPGHIVLIGARSRKTIDPNLLNQGHIAISSDNGFSWRQATINGVVGNQDFNEGYALSFPTPAIGYAGGSLGEGTARRGPWLRSLDSGNTWQLMDSTLVHPIYSMSFANVHSGTAVGLDGKTSHTSDGGAPWVEVTSGTALTLNAVHHSALQTAFAVGGKTAIIRLTTNDTIVTLSAPRTPVAKKHDMLRSIYPNPTRELATFEIEIERTMAVTLSLFDVKGNKVASIYDGILPNGVHEANLDVSKLTAGIYFARLDSPDGSEMMKVIVQ